MKKSVFLTILILFSTHFLFSQEVKIIESILIEHVDLKVEKVQKILQLSDFEVGEIKKIELECLQKIQKLESRKRCNLQKRTQKLVIERDERLKKNPFTRKFSEIPDYRKRRIRTISNAIGLK